MKVEDRILGLDQGLRDKLDTICVEMKRRNAIEALKLAHEAGIMSDEDYKEGVSKLAKLYFS